jgi:hypothetical protein
MNINLKIEAKKTITSEGIAFIREQGLSLKDIYKGLNKSHFLLPYKVSKLSKKARRK